MKKIVSSILFSPLLWGGVVLADCGSATQATIYNNTSTVLYAYGYSPDHGAPLTAAVTISPDGHAHTVTYGSGNCAIYINTSSTLEGSSPTTDNYCGTTGIVNQYGAIEVGRNSVIVSGPALCSLD